MSDRIRLFLDIETIKAPESLKSLFLETLREPFKKTADVKQWQEQEFLRTSLDGTFGQILCIGYIKEPPVSYTAHVIAGDEQKILTKFWNIARDADLFIGHNILNFDLKFIWKRSIIHNIKPSKDIGFARYRNDPIYDTMQEWIKWDTRDHVSLDLLAKLFGYPTSKGKMDGSMVQEYHDKGRDEDIYDYCKADVELNRKVYYRMIGEIP